ncbi:hypothetical protein HY489_05770 [Candidatus Woesearchaeota archaeon]|nr:hypothetical protein [Candidatus Woesearchaeota archaeon]
MDCLKKLYKEEAKKCIAGIKKSVQKLDKNSYDEKVLLELRRLNHMLRGSSLQMGYNSVAIIAQEISDNIKNLVAALQKKDLDGSRDIFIAVKALIKVLKMAVAAELNGKSLNLKRVK